MRAKGLLLLMILFAIPCLGSPVAALNRWCFTHGINLDESAGIRFTGEGVRVAESWTNAARPTTIEIQALDTPATDAWWADYLSSPVVFPNGIDDRSPSAFTNRDQAVLMFLQARAIKTNSTSVAQINAQIITIRRILVELTRQASRTNAPAEIYQ